MGSTSHGWRKSSFSDQGDCVELKFSAGRVLVRNSRRPTAGSLAFTPRKWQEFLAGLSTGELIPLPDDD